MSRLALLAASLLVATALRPAGAHQDPAQRWLDDCQHGHWGDEERYCDVRNFTIDRPSGSLTITPGMNGSITVHGWDQPTMRVVAMIQANAETQADAKALASDIRVAVTDAGIRADGPSMRRHRGWSVSLDVYVPRATNLDASTMNGGITVAQLGGRMDLRTMNGGIHLADIAGNVRAETTNGGIDAALSGSTPIGDGVDLRTTNGGITVALPQDYNARLEAASTNGGFSADFPITVQGRLGRTISTTIGHGGALVRAETVNGGVRIRRR
jgi:DUF4097 and DUF4098 domain-containing protein YvlB